MTGKMKHAKVFSGMGVLLLIAAGVIGDHLNIWGKVRSMLPKGLGGI